MEDFIWSKVFSVNVELFDKQHQKLFDIGKRLYYSIMESNSHEKIATIMEELCNYAIYHFEDEEYYMEKFDYKDIETHKAAHQKFRTQIEQFRQDHQKNKSFLPIKIINFLQQWLLDHILIEDKAYGPLLKDKATRSISESSARTTDC